MADNVRAGVWKTFNSSGIIAKIFLVPDKNYWDIGTEVLDFWCPFLRDILKRVWRIDRKAHKDNIRIRIGQRA